MTFFVRRAVVSVAILALAGCGGSSRPDVARFVEPALRSEAASAGGDPDACYETVVTPAVVETVTELEMERAPGLGGAGRVARPAIYNSRASARIVEERRELAFQTPCPDEMTPQFIASLQRALAARELYRGPVNGVMTSATRAAIRRFQAPEGLDSDVMSTAGAKRLGLAVYRRDEALARG